MAKDERVGTADDDLETCTERRRGRGRVGEGGIPVARETRAGRVDGAFPRALAVVVVVVDVVGVDVVDGAVVMMEAVAGSREATAEMEAHVVVIPNLSPLSAVKGPRRLLTKSRSVLGAKEKSAGLLSGLFRQRTKGPPVTRSSRYGTNTIHSRLGRSISEQYSPPRRHLHHPDTDSHQSLFPFPPRPPSWLPMTSSPARLPWVQRFASAVLASF